MDRIGTAGASRVVAGRYVLLERLGAGGMGAVWRARDETLDREVAVKEVLWPPGLPDDERDRLRERTRREARAAARLHHPNAVTVHDVVEDGGAPFIVMELVEARTLAEVVRTDGPLPPAVAAEVGLGVLAALQAAHRQGIVHRDVKPGNVLLCDAGPGRAPGRVVLTDFGIATSSGDSSLTSTGLLLGSPSYLAPERARGERSGPASDLWSLGATLFAAVEGRPPYDAGEPLATLAALALGEQAPFVAAGPLEPVLRGLLVQDPAQRLDAAAARAALTEVVRAGQQPTVAPRPAPAADGLRTDRTTLLPVPAPVPAEALPAPAPQPAEPAADLDEDHDPGLALPPPARPSRPVRPGAPRRRRAVPAAVAALAVLGAGLGATALTLEGSDDPRSPASAAGTPGSSAPSADPSADGAAPEDEGQPEPDRTTSAPSAEASPATEAPAAATSGGAAPPPAGWQSSTGGPGWTVFVPASWAAGSFNGSPEFRDRATARTVRISTTGPGGGKDDAVQDRRDQAASFADRYPSYREIRIEPIDYRGYEAADWEFTYTSGGTALHVLSRVFVVEGRGYSLFFQTRASDDWDAARADFERISRSFVPA